MNLTENLSVLLFFCLSMLFPLSGKAPPPFTAIPPPLILSFNKYSELPDEIFIGSLNEIMHLEGLVKNQLMASTQ